MPSRSTAGKLVAFWKARAGTPRLYVARPNGGGLRLLPEPVPAANAYGAALAFSPDGSRLLAVTTGSSCKLFLVDLRSLHSRRVGDACAASWSPDGTTSFAALTERARRLNAHLTGHRYLFGTIRVGGSDLALDGAAVCAAREQVAALRVDSARGWRELLFNSSFQDRLPDIGVVTAAHAERLGAVGPAARAAGLAEDVREHSPRLAYEGFGAIVPRRAAGDVRARLEQRALELLQTFDVLERLLDGPVRTAPAEPGGQEGRIGVGRSESPRGATTCVVERSGDHIERLHLRTGSYANWPAVAHAAADNWLPDFPLINKSFELCYACADR